MLRRTESMHTHVAVLHYYGALQGNRDLNSWTRYQWCGARSPGPFNQNYLRISVRDRCDATCMRVLNSLYVWNVKKKLQKPNGCDTGQLIQGLQHQNGKWILDRDGSTAVRDVPVFLLLYYTFLDFYCSNCLCCDVYHTYLLNINQWFNFLHTRIESRPAGIQNGQLWYTWVRNNEISISASGFWKTLAGRFHASFCSMPSLQAHTSLLQNIKYLNLTAHIKYGRWRVAFGVLAQYSRGIMISRIQIPKFLGRNLRKINFRPDFAQSRQPGRDSIIQQQ